MCVIVDTSCLAIFKVMSKKSDSLVQWFIFYVKFFIFRVQFLLTSAHSKILFIKIKNFAPGLEGQVISSGDKEGMLPFDSEV